MAKKKQWHPVFAALLRPLLESHFEVRTNVPVGDAPRLADITLVRRTGHGPLPFTGLWRNLTPWNVLEYKGPTVSPRDRDLNLLAEVGIGIWRCLNEQQAAEKLPLLAPEETSFWYLADRLGRRLLARWRQRAAGFQELEEGVWRCDVLGHPVFLVSGAHLPIEEDALPLHLIGQEGGERELSVAQFLVTRPPLWEVYRSWLAALHRSAYEEVLAMARATKQPLHITLEPIVESMGVEWVIQQVGLERVIAQVGLKRVIDEVGLKRVIDEVGMGPLSSALTAAQRRELRRLLDE